MLVGTYQHTIDTKGRVFIPAKLRSDLGEHFFVNKGVGGCIRAYSITEWENVLERLKTGTASTLALRRHICASTIDVDIDSQGRILLPEKLRVYADITDKATIVGVGEWVELWSPDKYDIIANAEFNDDDIALMDSLGIC